MKAITTHTFAFCLLHVISFFDVLGKEGSWGSA
jgi:hypothetical protein